VTFGEGKGCAAAFLRERARRLLRIEADDIEIDQLATEQLIPHGATDEIGLLARKHLADQLEQIRRRR